MLYNNIDMSKYMRIIDIRGRGLTEQELTTVRVPGSDEDYVTYRTKPPRYLEIDYEIRANDKGTLRKKIDEVSAIIATKENIPIIFRDESDRIYYGEYAGVEENIEYHHIGIHRGTIFILRDKYKYSSHSNILTFPADIVTFDNNGTAEADPIFELTAKKKTTFAMVSNGDEEYNLIGKPADVDEVVVDPKTLLLSENGETLNTWTTAPPEMEGGSQGTIGYDGAGITAPTYGTGTGYHGPSVFKEVPVTQDFEVELRGQLLTEDLKETGRIGFYLYDQNMQQIAFMAAIDNSIYVQRKLVEGRIGPFIGDFKNYLISSQNYQKQWDNFPALLRLTRVGDTYTFYAARILGDGKHMEPLTASWTVFEDKFKGRLKYVGIFIDKYGDSASPHTNRIDYIKTYALVPRVVDKTPYILDVGDVVTFDHKAKDILLNGESRKDLKNFGGSFFNLKKGENMLIVTPEDSFDTKVKFQERFL